MSKKPTIVKEVERHPLLGYDLNAPLPYFLDDETLFGHYEVKNEDWSIDQAFAHTEKVLASFLNSTSQFYNPDPTVLDPFKLPQIDEVLFVKSYLPNLYESHSVDEHGNDHAMLAWVNNVALTQYAPVNVLREGKLIYRVPPALSKINVIRANERQYSPTILGKQIEGEINRLPALRDRKTRELLGALFIPREGISTKNFRNTVELKYLFTLDEIFTYYGYKSILTPEIMSIKSQILGTPNATTGSVQSTTAARKVQPDDEEDDSDLFG